jgi:hypothetical protein
MTNEDKIRIVDLIEQLLEDRGNLVTFYRGFPGIPAVECRGEWTAWEGIRYESDTFILCLEKALEHYKEYGVEKRLDA